MDIDSCKIVSYGDDTSLTFWGVTWEEVILKAQHGFNKVCHWLAANRLSLNASKTKCITIRMRNSYAANTVNHKIVAHTCSVATHGNCSCSLLDRVDNIKYLGVTIDSNLNFKQHICNLSSKIRKLT
jgi:hypothetical protein